MSNLEDRAIEAAANRLIVESQAHLTKGAYDRLRGNMGAYRDMARAALEAAAPLIEARALREAADGILPSVFIPFGGKPIDINDPQREYLRNRANQITENNK